MKWNSAFVYSTRLFVSRVQLQVGSSASQWWDVACERSLHHATNDNHFDYSSRCRGNNHNTNHTRYYYCCQYLGSLQNDRTRQKGSCVICFYSHVMQPEMFCILHLTSGLLPPPCSCQSSCSCCVRTENYTITSKCRNGDTNLIHIEWFLQVNENIVLLCCKHCPIVLIIQS